MAFDAKIVRIFNDHGFNVTQTHDFYSPLPSVSALEKTIHRWSKSSELIGIDYRLSDMKAKLRDLLSKHRAEYQRKVKHKEISAKGYGPGFPVLDAMLLYSMVRDRKPQRYLEIGSGVSTYYCRLVAEENLTKASRQKLPALIPIRNQRLLIFPRSTSSRKKSKMQERQILNG